MVSESKSTALFIESIGKGELLDNGTYKAFSKIHYDTLFKHKCMKVYKEGRYSWNGDDEMFEHYTHTDTDQKTVQFNRTYFWIVSRE